MAEITALTTLSDYTARLSTQAYNRLFAKDGGSTPDATYAALIVAEANSLFRTMTRAAFPDGVYTTGDTVDPAIVGCIVDLGCSIAASRHVSYDPEGGYAVGGARARAFIKELNRDADATALTPDVGIFTISGSAAIVLSVATSAELAAAQRADLARWEKPIKATGVQLD